MAQHLSIRIPWKDNGYNGLICDKPCYNNSCLRLKNISSNRDDTLEEELKGKSIQGHEDKIPCLAEGGCFMSSYTLERVTVHPYKKTSEEHKHFLDTKLTYPPFSFPARPFGWLMLQKSGTNNIEYLKQQFDIGFEERKEPRLSFNTNWVQAAENQRAIFKSFYEDVNIGSSLIVPYAKQVPFIDDSRRIIMGIGRVTSIVEPPEHNHLDSGSLRSILWETMVGHSIRNDRKDGFLIPYQEMIEYATDHPDFDIQTICVFADDDYFEEFSYATEHLSYDAVINVLLQIIKVLNIVKNCIEGNWDECIEWSIQRLNEVIKDRGPFPGLGAMISALGVDRGHLLAKEIRAHVDDNSNYESIVCDAFKNPENYFSKRVLDSLNFVVLDTFNNLPPKRKELFWLLSRMSLSDEQANCIFNVENRERLGIYCKDEAIINNPYILFENTVNNAPDYVIHLKKIDMAVFPPSIIESTNPLEFPSKLLAENDKRRVRAYFISLLEAHSIDGHTVYPLTHLMKELNELPILPTCRVTGDIINSFSEYLDEALHTVKYDNGKTAYQLHRLHEIDEVIRKSVQKRINGARFDIDEDWIQIINNEFDNNIASLDDRNARKEKAVILKELANSRISVLIGGAGTGKTTLLSLLCKSKQINAKGILLLAPTGKARVRLSQEMEKHRIPNTAKTVAQFLAENGRFNCTTMRYHLSEEKADNVPCTVIIDESSMLTEEMFGALLQSLKKAERIIFSGDPNQLPPIGSGRPFVDLVRYLSKNITGYPKVCRNFGQLTVTMRQTTDGVARKDIDLAKCFSSDYDSPNENLFFELENGELSKYVSFRKWDTPEELERLIYKTISEETIMENEDDVLRFHLSTGGSKNKDGWLSFNENHRKIEDWQIISASRNDAVLGTSTINRYLHEKYDIRKIDKIKESIKIRKINQKCEIIFGDKIINVRNQFVKRKGADDGFVANGEIGIVCWEEGNKLNIIFSSQPAENIYCFPSSISDEKNSDLELAYALTVHKVQGSEFNKVILVLGEPSRLLSKELLYTAITRHKQRLIILYNKNAIRLRDYALDSYSVIAKRFTCLFDGMRIVEYKNQFYESSLIHTTIKGEMVRSKSEVIIANMLYAKDIDYEYEQELCLGEDGVRYPDFTINDEESGMLFYWEHCGMLEDANYKKKWEEKKKVYEKHGILEGKNLIVSRDTSNGAIDSRAIENLIEKYLL